MGWFNHQLVNVLSVLICEYSLRCNLGDGTNQVPSGISFERDFLRCSIIMVEKGSAPKRGDLTFCKASRVFGRYSCYVLNSEFKFFKGPKSVASFYSALIFVACPPLQVWSLVEMSHLNVCRTVGYVNVCLKIPANGAKDRVGFLCFFGGISELLRKFWKRQCVEKLQGIETETPRKIISSVEDEPSMKVVILVRYPFSTSSDS